MLQARLELEKPGKARLIQERRVVDAYLYTGRSSQCGPGNVLGLYARFSETIATGEAAEEEAERKKRQYTASNQKVVVLLPTHG